MINRSDWDGCVRGRDDSFDSLHVRVPSPSGGTWSGPFRAVASDSRQYFVKGLDTCPPGQEASVATEHVVARVGRLIGAPMCETSLIRIPDALAGYPVTPTATLSAGLAHASLALARADEQRPSLAARAQDDNSRRHVGVYALFDWCCGTDAQWLYDLDNDRAVYSHDHGLYFPPTSAGGWTEAELTASLDADCGLPDTPDGLSKQAIEDTAQALETVTRDSLASILNSVPASWPVDNTQLEALGRFLEHRAPAVATRLRALN